jgi:hypothetical protein
MVAAVLMRLAKELLPLILETFPSVPSQLDFIAYRLMVVFITESSVYREMPLIHLHDLIRFTRESG